jgi:hypothetical protein
VKVTHLICRIGTRLVKLLPLLFGRFVSPQLKGG